MALKMIQLSKYLTQRSKEKSPKNSECVQLFAATYACWQRVKDARGSAKNSVFCPYTPAKTVSSECSFCSSGLIICRRKAQGVCGRLLLVWFRSEMPFPRYLESRATHTARSAGLHTWRSHFGPKRKGQGTVGKSVLVAQNENWVDFPIVVVMHKNEKTGGRFIFSFVHKTKKRKCNSNFRFSAPRCRTEAWKYGSTGPTISISFWLVAEKRMAEKIHRPTDVCLQR